MAEPRAEQRLAFQLALQSQPVSPAVIPAKFREYVMPSYHIVFESKEEIYGILPQAHDWVHYSALLQVKDGGKFPVVLEMEFVPPHPYAFNLPEVRNRVGPQQLFDIDLNGSEVDL